MQIVSNVCAGYSTDKERGIKLVVLQNLSANAVALVYFRISQQSGTNFTPTPGTVPTIWRSRSTTK